MRQAFMSSTKGRYDFEGYDACRDERSTWASWRT
jgi:hypothetical protein